MTPRRESVLSEERRRDAALLGVTIVVSGLLMLGGVTLALTADGGTDGVNAVPVDAAAGPRASVTVQAPRRHRVSLPLRIAIPRLGVRARIVRLGLSGDGTLEVPDNFADTGWWSGGSRPGEPGPAVVAGHVDSRRGPAVFFRLGSLRRGDVIRIGRRDGTVVRFAVQRLARYPAGRFPGGRVYGATRRPTLRLITCAGDFDRSTGRYRDITVVYATLVARR
ncbi:MAG: putative sortase family protein [Solirubrobacterales bacterium]|nr:putative sortase family protein [Solirubrobacterales bacterium]